MADTLSELTKIINKVRQLTRSPSENQITTAQITDYINTFVLYDFPQQLRTFPLKKNLTFYTQPYVDTYSDNTVNPGDPLYNFSNKYLSIHTPVYVSGNEIFYTQSEDQFYRLYPKITNQIQLGTGDGMTILYTGTITGVPIYRNAVIFSSIDSNNEGITVVDQPKTNPSTGYPMEEGNLVEPNFTSIDRGDINYVTGAYSISFPAPPATGKPIYLQVVQYQVNVPQAMLYFDRKFVLRPVPDKAYAIQVDVMQRPSELLSSNSIPELAAWSQFIAYGAAKKIFEDRMDLESVQLIMPEFKNQREFCIGTTYAQQKNERSSTIYTDQSEALVSGWGRGGWF